MDQLATLLSDLVAIDSVNPDLVPGGAGEAALAAYIAEWGRREGFEVIIQEAAEDRPNVVLIARGRGGGKSLMLNAHTDTVGVIGMDAPFSPVIRGGRLHGRGSYDMKSGLAAGMLALKAARDMALSGDVMLGAVADEEYGSVGTEALLRDWARWKADAVLIAEPTELCVSVAHRGFVWLEFETYGVAAHGSRPHLGIDAIAKMGQVLVALAAHDRQLRANPTHDLLGSGSLHASTIEGGEEISMYPAHCKLLVEWRTIPGDTPESVEREAKAMLERIAATDPDFRASARASFSRSPFSIAPDHALVRSLKRHADACLGRETAIMGNSWWMDAALFWRGRHPDGGAGTGRRRRPFARRMGQSGVGGAVPGDIHGADRRFLSLTRFRH